MNTRYMEYFVALVDEHSFRGAAHRLGVSQPAITQALRHLEDEYGVILIARNRNRGHWQVTPAGTALYGFAQSIISQVAAAASALTRIRQQKIALGFPPIIGNYYFPRLAERLKQAGLIGHLETTEEHTDLLLRDVRAGTLDLALVGTSAPVVANDLVVHPIATAPFCVIVPNDHPLATQSVVDFATFAQTPFISFARGQSHARAFEWFVQHSGARPEVLYQSADIMLIKQMVRQGAGVALLTSLAIQPRDHLVALKLSGDEQPRLSITTVQSAQQAYDPLLRQLREVVADFFELE